MATVEMESKQISEQQLEQTPQTETSEMMSEMPDQETTQEKPKSERPRDIESLKPGMRLKGKVRNIVEFGAFIDIGVGRDGLAHISTLKRAGIDKTLKRGDILDVQVRRVDVERNRISLTIPGAGRGAKTALRDLEVGRVVTGRVVRLVDFGAFVDIGAQTDGLLHVSQLPWGYVNDPREVLSAGDEIQVRILDVDIERRRISLTMKNAAQPEESPKAQEETREESADERFPTAFAVAWERALRAQRGRR